MKKKPQSPKPLMLRVVFDRKASAEDVSASLAAIERLRDVAHVDPIVDSSVSADTPVDQIGLTARPRNALQRAKITTVGKLTAHSRFELRHVKHLGKRGIDEVVARLASRGLRLRPQTASEFTAATVEARKHNNEKRAAFLKAFETTRQALRSLWTTAAQKGYVNRDWAAWRLVDAGLRAYVRGAAEAEGIELDYDDVVAMDPEPFLATGKRP